MSILYIRLPSKATADSIQPGTPLYCHFALASDAGAVEREGMAALPELAEAIRRVQRVVLLLAASDVTLLQVKVPPLSAARLKAALPNLVEDQLMSDPEECVVVAGAAQGDLRTVAVVHRGWLELLSKTLVTLGARGITAVPAQLCLPQQANGATAAVIEHGTDSDVAVRLSEHDGIGLSITADQPESVPLEVIQALCAVVPHAPIAVYAPQTRLHSYQEVLDIAPAVNERVTLYPDDWARWIAGAAKAAPDMMTGLGASSGPKLNWRPWRWPLALAAAVLLVNALALNIDWLRMKREAEALRASMIQTYKSAFPNENVIVDPVAQMRQKVAAAQRQSGQLAPDDFVALTAALGEALANAGQSTQAIAGLEYRDRSLSVKLKAGTNLPMDRIRAALQGRNLSVSQASADVWQIRSAK